MAVRFIDLVRQFSASTGTGNFTLSGAAPTGYKTFSSQLATGDTFYYSIQNLDKPQEVETGLGTWLGANNFSRTTGPKTAFSSGKKQVSLTVGAAWYAGIDNSAGGLPALANAVTALQNFQAGISETIDDRVAALLVAGTGLQIAYDDAGNVITLTNIGGSGTTLNPPGNAILPNITGTLTEGNVLSVTDGTWTNSPTSYSYQWRRSGVNIVGAVASTYTLASADVAKVITCAVTATNADGSTTVISNSVGPVIAASGLGKPVPTGSARFTDSSVTPTAVTAPVAGQKVYLDPGPFSPAADNGYDYTIEANSVVVDSGSFNNPYDVSFTFPIANLGESFVLICWGKNAAGTSTTSSNSAGTASLVEVNLSNNTPAVSRSTPSGTEPMEANVTYGSDLSDVWPEMTLDFEVGANQADMEATPPVISRHAQLLLLPTDLPTTNIRDFETRGVVLQGSDPWTGLTGTEKGRLRLGWVGENASYFSPWSLLFGPQNLATGHPVTDNFDDGVKNISFWGNEVAPVSAAIGTLQETSSKLIYTHPGTGGGGGKVWPTVNAVAAAGSFSLFRVASIVGGAAEAILTIGTAVDHGVRCVITPDAAIYQANDGSGPSGWGDTSSVSLDPALYSFIGLHLRTSDKKVRLVGVLASNTGQSMPPVVGDLVDLVTPIDFSGFRSAYYNFDTNPACRDWLGGDSWSGASATIELEDYYSTRY